jgi:hypothetical protein
MLRKLIVAAALVVCANVLVLTGMSGIIRTVAVPAGVQFSAIERVPASFELKPAAIPRIVCVMPPDKDGVVWFHEGTGAWIGKDMAITADHVVAHAQACSIEGQKVTRMVEDGGLDYAVLIAYNQSGVVAQISCDGIIAGKQYRAVGYAAGETYTRTAIWIGLAGKVDDPTFQYNGLSRFDGLGMEGMSGGPITEADTGKIAAIVNAGNEHPPHDSWALADTYLCPRRA